MYGRIETEGQKLPRHRPVADCIAALDLGTNNCRLLVAQEIAGELRIVDRFSRIVRLGEGVGHAGELTETAIRRTMQALRVCAHIMARHRVRLARCVATEACRSARNSDRFIERVRSAIGIDLEVLDHEDEAALALLGCLPLIAEPTRQIMLVDIGGGSTEVVLADLSGTKPEILSLSVPRGVVELSERMGADPSEDRYQAMVESTAAALASHPDFERMVQRYRGDDKLTVIGCSGTVTTLAAMHLGLRRYDRRQVDGVWLDEDQMRRASAMIRSMGHEARRAHPCIGRDRADLVVAGCAIFEGVQRHWPAKRLRVADRGIREGILAELTGHSLERELRRRHH